MDSVYTFGGATWTGATTYARSLLRLRPGDTIDKAQLILASVGGTTYAATSAEAGYQLVCRVEAGNSGPNTTIVYSDPTPTITPIPAPVPVPTPIPVPSPTPTPVPTPTEAIPPSNTKAPTLFGTAQVDQTLTGDTGLWAGSAPISLERKWQTGGVDIPNTNVGAHKIAAGEVGKKDAFLVRATNPYGPPTAWVSSNLSDTIVAAPAPSPSPTWATPGLLVPAPPVLSSPTIISGTKQFDGIGTSYTFANKKTDPAHPPTIVTKTTGGVYDPATGKGTHIELLDYYDLDLTGAAGLVRIQYETVDLVRIRRVKLPQGRYAPGVIAGILHIGHGRVGEILAEDIEYDRVEPLTSSGDIYAGLFTGGGHASGSPTAYGWVDKATFRNCKISHCLVDYTGTSSAGDYPNSDGYVAENQIKNVTIEDCQFLHGSDAGIDRKSPNTKVSGTVIDDWRECLKTWVPASDVDVYSLNARHAHHVITPQGGVGRLQYHAEHTTYVGTNANVPLFDIQRAGGNIVIDHVDLSGLPSGQVLAICESSAYGSTIKLGNTNYTINSSKVML